MADELVKILVAEDDPELSAYLEMALRCFGYRAEIAQDGNEALECLESNGGDIAAVLLDFVMPNRDGEETLRQIRRLYPDLPVIVISGTPSPVTIVNAMQAGARDFLCKPVSHDDLRNAISRALDVANVTSLRPVKTPAPAPVLFLGKSRSMSTIQSAMRQIGWSEASVLIQGETGSGKEVIAREIHANSPRAKKPFFKLNCAALPSELVESELFGYERGAFTGAFQRKPGSFEIADGGTILLDEIGDMDVRLQAKLLQVLQDHEFRRIGGKDTIKVDVRVIAATHRDLEESIRERRFRADLFYRLNVVTLHVPPLRERKEDIIELAEFLLKKHVKPGAPAPRITPELRSALLAWHWPGNVRELENFARKLLIFQDPDEAARELNERAVRAPVAIAASTARLDDVDLPILEQVTKAKQQAEAETILTALNATRWNRKQAAALLKIDYKALLYKMKKLGMDDKAPADLEEARPRIMRAGSS